MNACVNVRKEEDRGQRSDVKCQRGKVKRQKKRLERWKDGRKGLEGWKDGRMDGSQSVAGRMEGWLELSVLLRVCSVNLCVMFRSST